MEPINTANEFAVGVNGDEIVILFWRQRITKEQALRLAAHLVILADDKGEFPQILEAVTNA